MTKRIATLCLLLFGVLMTDILVAEQGAENIIKKSLSKVVPITEIGQISPSPVAGVSEVLIGMNVFYVTNDGKYVLKGNLIEIESRTDLTERRLGSVRMETISKVDESSMIIFPAKNQRHTITVFTDIDCGYCRKLHKEITSYNEQGITVRYLSFPRTGPNSPSFDKAVSVWCADNRNAALTSAKAGVNPPDKKCDNPVKVHFDLGIAMGLRGTPAIVLESGDLLPGYVPAKQLVRELDRLGKEKS